jgi:hypothetical protein
VSPPTPPRKKAKRHATGYAMMWRRMTACSRLAQNPVSVNELDSYLGILNNATNDLLPS